MLIASKQYLTIQSGKTFPKYRWVNSTSSLPTQTMGAQPSKPMVTTYNIHVINLVVSHFCDKISADTSLHF